MSGLYTTSCDYSMVSCVSCSGPNMLSHSSALNNETLASPKSVTFAIRFNKDSLGS